MIQNYPKKRWLISRSSSYLVLIIVLIIGIFVIYKGREIYISAENAAVESCTSSIESVLAMAIDNEEIRKIINPSQEWKVLSKDQQEFLFDSTKNDKHFDCSRFQFLKKGKNQSGRDLQISVRQTDSRTEVRIEDLQ